MKVGKRSSKFIRQFKGINKDSNIVCFSFWQLVPAGGCPYRCAYCFLQTTPWFRFKPEVLSGLIYINIEDMLQELKKWLIEPIPKMLVVGELQDGLVFEKIFYKKTGKSLTQWIVPLFAQQKRHKVIFLTKSVCIDFILELEPTDQVIFSWSVNAEYVSKKWEHGAPLTQERFEAAEQIKSAGWNIRLRLDPIVPYDNWQNGYEVAIQKINLIKPEMLTLGILRATSKKLLRLAAQKNKRDDSIFSFLTERDASNFKYRIPYKQQLELYNFVLERLSPEIIPALCKEDLQIWHDLNIPFQGCHCLLNSCDWLIKKRISIIDR